MVCEATYSGSVTRQSPKNPDAEADDYRRQYGYEGHKYNYDRVLGEVVDAIAKIMKVGI